MNKKIMFPSFFLVVYVAVFIAFIFSWIINGFMWLNVFAIVVSVGMAYLKIIQIIDIRKNSKE